MANQSPIYYPPKVRRCLERAPTDVRVALETQLDNISILVLQRGIKAVADAFAWNGGGRYLKAVFAEASVLFSVEPGSGAVFVHEVKFAGAPDPSIIDLDKDAAS